MSFFKVSAPPPGKLKANDNNTNDFTFSSDSDNDNPKPERAPSPPRGNLFSHQSSFLAVQAERLARERKKKEREERKRRERSEERRERKAGKKKQQRETDTEGVKEEGSGKMERGKGELKRRRISAKDGEALLKKALAGTQVVELSSEDERGGGTGSMVEQNEVSPVRRSPRRAKAGGQYATGPISRSTIPLPNQNDNDDDEDLQITATRPTTRRQPSSDEDSDPEIAELSRKARAAAAERRRIAEEGQRSTATNDSSATSTSALPTSTHPLPPTSSDPIISILITSPMPSTDAMIIRRKVSQTLGAVREAYCRRWQIPHPETVFLTFCGRRLYDSTICLRLGLVVEEGSGRVKWERGKGPNSSSARMSEQDGGDDEEEEEVKVHVEAVNEEWYKMIREERDRERRERFAAAAGGGEIEDVMGGEGGGEVETGIEQKEEQQKQEKTWRLLVKAKGKKDFKVRVTADTLFSKILLAAKRSFGMPDDTEVWMEFDGERLDPEIRVGDSEVEDLDGLEVYVVK